MVTAFIGALKTAQLCSSLSPSVEQCCAELSEVGVARARGCGVTDLAVCYGRARPPVCRGCGLRPTEPEQRLCRECVKLSRWRAAAVRSLCRTYDNHPPDEHGSSIPPYDNGDQYSSRVDASAHATFSRGDGACGGSVATPSRPDPPPDTCSLPLAGTPGGSSRRCPGVARI